MQLIALKVIKWQECLAEAADNLSKYVESCYFCMLLCGCPAENAAYLICKMYLSFASLRVDVGNE